MRRILIFGGYGTFGGRLVRLLADEPRLTLLVAGRSLARAKSFCESVGGRATLEPIALDRDGDIAVGIASARADIVVDASGPFQAYGAEPYRVVEAALAASASYIDLSDSADFVRHIGRFDQIARTKGLFVLAGASSFPVLSTAAVRHLTTDGAEPATVVGGVAPSPHAGIGENVVRAIANYAGRPVPMRRGGRDASGIALVEHREMTVAPPGRLPLKRRRFSLIEVPDLVELPRLWPRLESAWIGAGTVPRILHRGLNLMARLVNKGVLPSLEPLAVLFHKAINVLRWGEHRGGVVIAVTGTGPDGAAMERSWHLLAEGDAGPFIPSMAAETLIRSCLDGQPPQPGARSAAAELTLADFAPAFARHGIVHGLRDDRAEAADGSLYRRVLGAAFGELPPALRAMHGCEPILTARGFATVERGRGPFALLAALVIGFPASGDNVPLEVRFERTPDRELWTRSFAGRRFRSIQELGTDRHERLIIERFGLARFALALVVDSGRLKLVPRAWSVLGVPMPLALAPGGEAFEEQDAQGRFRFHVEIGHALLGRFVRYRGWLEPIPA
jgi:hypothetical protein